jgi:peptide/nickel transport system substrate-binding protein
MSGTAVPQQIRSGAASGSGAGALPDRAVTGLFPICRVAAGCVLLSVLVSACSAESRFPEAYADEVPLEQRYGGTAVVAHRSDIPTVNPLFIREAVGREILQFVLFTPVLRLAERQAHLPARKLDEKYEPVPALARSWELLPTANDSAVLVLHLRDDVYWHDGVKTTAWDLKFVYDHFRAPPSGGTRAFLDYGPAEVVDSFTFRVKLRPHVDYLQVWQSVAALPRHLLADVPAGELEAHPFGTDDPVGNGPFRFVSRVRGESWTFEANPDYPAELGGRPYLDRLIYRVIADRDEALQELLAGRVDYLISLGADQTEAVRAASSSNLVTFPSQAQAVLAWNTRNQPISDVRVRRALTLAIDRQRLIDKVLFGYGQLANSPVPPMHWAYDAAVGADLRHDPEQARRLLSEVGWADRDGDGQLEDAAGRPFRLRVITTVGSHDLLAAVAADLRAVGIVMDIEQLDIGTMLERIAKREYDGVVTGVSSDFRLDVRRQFHCANVDEALQLSGYCDPATDELMDMTQLLVDRDEARAAWQALQQRLAHDQPYTFLYFAERLVGVNDRLLDTRPDARGEWHNVSRWWIHPEKRDGRLEAQARAAIGAAAFLSAEAGR